MNRIVKYGVFCPLTLDTWAKIKMSHPGAHQVYKVTNPKVVNPRKEQNEHVDAPLIVSTEQSLKKKVRG